MTSLPSIAGRYELLELLGEGTSPVYVARDCVSGDRVAVKLLRGVDEAARAAIRREAAALRFARLPGVVTFRDDGRDGDTFFLVTDIVDGLPFPGVTGVVAWADIADVVGALVESLARLHGRGLVHGDVKPDNILVRDGRVTLIDLGLAARGPGSGGGALSGSPSWLAPERFRARPVSVAADLYAVGVMLHHALSGSLPHPTDSLASLVRARLFTPAPPLASVAPGVPEPVARLVDDLLEREPAARPSSARAVLERLFGAAGRSGLPPFPAGVTLDAAALGALIAAPERLFHAHSDAVQELLDRTGGEPAAVHAELSAWIGAGFARWEAGRVALTPAAVGELRGGPSLRPFPESALAPASGEAGRLERLVLAGEWAAAAEEAVLAGEVALREGRLEGGDVKVGLRAARTAERKDLEPPLLALAARMAFLQGSPVALDAVLQEIGWARAHESALEPLEALVRASLAGLGSDAARARALGEAVPPLEDVELDRVRVAVRVLSARRGSLAEEEGVVDEAVAWAERRQSASGLAAAWGWLGRLRYRQERYDEAADLHLRCARASDSLIPRISALLNSVTARVDAGRPDEAIPVAAECLALCAGARQPAWEGRAEWAMRSAMYRAGAVLRVDRELLDAVALLDLPDLEGSVCLTEAAVLWRSGDVVGAAGVAERAERRWTAMGKRWAALLAGSLRLLGATEADAAADAVAVDAAACPFPGIALQALGLLALRAGPRADWVSTAESLAGALGHARRGSRLEVLSPEEALAAIRG